MKVSVAYAEPEKQMLLEFEMEAGSTVLQAIERSGILKKFSQIDLSSNKVGIFGKVVSLDLPLNDDDRVEIYRPALGKPPKKSRSQDEENTSEAPAGKSPSPTRSTAEEVKAESKTGVEESSASTAVVQEEDRQAKIAAAKARVAAAKAQKAAV
ncbi:MAG: RnfH family protein [Magnetococcus sp. DMHC-6]